MPSIWPHIASIIGALETNSLPALWALAKAGGMTAEAWLAFGGYFGDLSLSPGEISPGEKANDIGLKRFGR